MSINSDNLKRHELIGLKAEIVESTDSQLTGLSGEIIDETRDTFTIDSSTVIKKNCKFRFELPSGEEVELDGEDLKKRPEERI